MQATWQERSRDNKQVVYWLVDEHGDPFYDTDTDDDPIHFIADLHPPITVTPPTVTVTGPARPTWTPPAVIASCVTSLVALIVAIVR